jgi:hypothetical protein
MVVYPDEPVSEDEGLERFWDAIPLPKVHRKEKLGLLRFLLDGFGVFFVGEDGFLAADVAEVWGLGVG